MANLVKEKDVLDLLDESNADVGRVKAAVAEAEDLFTRACLRADRPFQPQEANRVEVKDGTGTRLLYLDYPIVALTHIKIGPDSSAPDETLDVTDKDVVRWKVGSKRLMRIDGVFGCKGDPLVIEVKYDAGEDLPPAAAAAVKAAAALLYRRGASDGSTSEQLGSHSVEFASGITRSLIEQEPAWQEGLRACRETV